MNRMRSLEDAGITIRVATEDDVPLVERFLSRPEIDSLFTPALSDPARGISIKERALSKFRQGMWVVALHDGEAIGCMATIPSKLTQDVPVSDPARGIEISEGVSFSEWGFDRLMELSTVVVDPKTKETLQVKGVGAELLNTAKDWVQKKGNGTWGLVTDSWVGGDMGGFVDAMNAKAYSQWLQGRGQSPAERGPDTLVRIYTDAGKRGKDGPPTVVYGIPITDRDWQFFLSKEDEIRRVRGVYEKLESQLAGA